VLGKDRRGTLVEAGRVHCSSFGRGYRGCSASVEAGEKRCSTSTGWWIYSSSSFSRRLEGALVVLLVR
jgi:hypothetical protein